MRRAPTSRGDHWLLNGSKTYISNGQLADLIIVAARTVPDKRYGIGLFVVEAGMPGFQRGRRLHKMGLQAQDTSELFFNDVRVPKTNVLGDPQPGIQLPEQIPERRAPHHVPSTQPHAARPRSI